MNQTSRWAMLLAGLGLLVTGCGMDSGARLRRELDLSGEGWRLSLDRKATWQDDALHLPPVDVKALPARPPTDGWDSLNDKNLAVAVPGTVEEYLWDEVGDYVGVSWWWRSFTPPGNLTGHRVLLKFAAVRLRAEVFLNWQLVAYDAIGNTPFEADITDQLISGQANHLTVRVTDPSGNFDWVDFEAHKWGEQTIPASHGFGGITGPVRLVIVGETYIDDIFVKNKPAITEADIDLTVRNTQPQETRHDLRVRILEAANPEAVIFDQTWPGQSFKPGEQTLTRTISLPNQSKTWSPASPVLYLCRVTLSGTDQADQRFGFRWFAPEGIGQDAVFRLNGKRIVLRSAISWGFWPTNGIFPTPELAEKNVRAAKALGLNMLNFHRCIGQPIVFDQADELGLLIFEEPGGYTSRGGDELCFALAREKLLRMVKRDRSRPSLIIYNLINEEEAPPGDRHKKDMADVHRLDPTRTIVYTSGWAKDGDDPIKLHMRPYDDRQYIRGWWDFHNACGPGVYRDRFYEGPDKFQRHSDNRPEIVFWGEEGANATPPRLELINRELQGRPNGWDGKDYRAWYEAYRRYLDDKKLRDFFPTVDALTRSLGNIQYYYQGRIIENIRAGDVTDGYVINGWEDEKLENHSGVVDCFRNFKGNEELLARHNGPLCVAVKLRNKVVQTPATVTADFYLINEVDLKGEFNLAVSLDDPAGRTVWTSTYPVKVSGGETYGELLVAGVAIRIEGAPGRYGLAARLDERSESKGAPPRVSGVDELLVVDWKNQKLPDRGAVIEENDTIRSFLKGQRGLDVPRFGKESGPLDYIVVGTCETMPHAVIPAEQLLTAEGKPGLAGEYFKGTRFRESVLKRTDPMIDFGFGPQGPDPKVGGEDFSVRWQGKVRAPESGAYVFSTMSDDGVRLWVDGQLQVDQWTNHAERLDMGQPIELAAGKEYDLKLEYFQGGSGAAIRLHWCRPSMLKETEGRIVEILRRVRDDGTTALFLDKTNEWAGLLARHGAVKYQGVVEQGLWWLGGNFFVRKHPLFADLPVNQAMNWEYQELVNYDRRRFGLLLEGEEAVVGSVTGHVHQVATAVGVVPFGKGRLVLSTLDILPVLDAPPGPADVVRKIFCNYLSFAGQGDRTASSSVP